jgi:uncharacterized protein (TIGR03067 family)
MKKQLLLILAIGWVMVGNQSPADDAEEKLQGKWVAVSAEKNGEEAEFIRGHHLTFGDVRYTITDKDGKLLWSGTYRTFPDQKPAGIDFRHADPKLIAMPWEGIYKLDGDSLTICDNAGVPNRPRPKEFTAKAGSGHVLVVFKRAKP